MKQDVKKEVLLENKVEINRTPSFQAERKQHGRFR
jgi:hypothetical protein